MDKLAQWIAVVGFGLDAVDIHQSLTQVAEPEHPPKLPPTTKIPNKNSCTARYR